MKTTKSKQTRKKSIPDEVKRQVEENVDNFNRATFRGDPSYYFIARFKGDCVYLDRYEYGRSGPICRLTWKGGMDNWEFAIYKYSKDRYDPDEWFFPGSGYVDGTVEGAMKAGMEAYP
jgi:hypothetical protein